MYRPVSEHADVLLGRLLDVMSNGVFTMDLTVSFGNLLVSGTPVKESRYLDSIGAELQVGYQAAAEGLAAEMAGQPGVEQALERLAEAEQACINAFARYGEKAERNVRNRLAFKAIDGAGEQGEGSVPLPRAYVYLENAELWMPAGSVARVSFWRGRLDGVTGWMIGRIGPSESQKTDEPPDLLSGATNLLRQFAAGYRAERDRQRQVQSSKPDLVQDAAMRGAAFADEFTSELIRK